VPRPPNSLRSLAPLGDFAVRTARWPEDAEALRTIRREVFIVEQNVPEELEWDGLDADCRHAIAASTLANGVAIGCGRLLPDGHIGRMAVREPWRGRGVGAALLRHLMDLALREGHARVVLNAQTHAMRFYERFGFTSVGEEFMEAGIPHRTMERILAR